MSDNKTIQLKLKELLNALELPEGAYDKATARYEDLGVWFDREGSALQAMNPHVFPQGSFALGTVIRPLHEDEEYDLDLGCKLRDGVSQATHTQEELKGLVGRELEEYRHARQIESPLQSKNRCWRLQYRDTLSFHMDVVPCIPAEHLRQRAVERLMLDSGIDQYTATDVARHEIRITDEQSQTFSLISSEWPSSNPQGYVAWFQSRMTPVKGILLDKALIDDVPLYRRKTPLQQCVQLLKRHRDQYFRNHSDLKPVSVIITTIAGHACDPTQDLAETLKTVLSALLSFRRSNRDEVPNPVDPKENFADRWSRLDCANLNLKNNFQLWVDQACADFNFLFDRNDASQLVEHISKRFAVQLDSARLSKLLSQAGIGVSASIAPRIVIAAMPPRPWGE